MSEQRIEEIFSRVNSAYYVFPNARPLDAHNDIYWLIEKYIPALRKEKDEWNKWYNDLSESHKKISTELAIMVGDLTEARNAAAALSEEGEKK